ncbi:XRE family transcriptional regulator [Ectothiorhodospiraceae bacterium BW-2]|nr:XRE family transcriptional regulator [Ectothiorhodospiraceae bacterium BW-2]
MSSYNEPLLQRLAEALRRQRLANNDTQLDAATRIGVSLGTYSKMERADPGTAIKHWLTAIDYYGNPQQLLDALAQSDELLDILEGGRSQQPRHRISRSARGSN